MLGIHILNLKSPYIELTNDRDEYEGGGEGRHDPAGVGLSFLLRLEAGW